MTIVLAPTAQGQIVEIESTTEGFLPPRMTTVQRDAIASPSDGMIIFNISSGRVNYYDAFTVIWLELHPGPHPPAPISTIDYFLSLSNGIQALLDAGETPLNIINAGAPLTDFIGLNHAGGIIFYMNPNSDGTGYVAAPSDQSTGAEWGCFGTDLPNVTNVTSDPPIGSGAEIGDGSTNTSNIIVDCPTAPAALACTQYNGGGFSDWFLPSAGELNEMYLKIGQGAGSPNTNIGNFADSFYWSSSEFDGNFAWGQIFVDGFQADGDKDDVNPVRAIRAF